MLKKFLTREYLSLLKNLNFLNCRKFFEIFIHLRNQKTKKILFSFEKILI
jgi:hypothetical protein